MRNSPGETSASFIGGVPPPSSSDSSFDGSAAGADAGGGGAGGLPDGLRGGGGATAPARSRASPSCTGVPQRKIVPPASSSTVRGRPYTSSARANGSANPLPLKTYTQPRWRPLAARNFSTSARLRSRLTAMVVTAESRSTGWSFRR